MNSVVILSAVRTAVGKFGGTLKDVNVADLGSCVIKESVKRSGIDAKLVEEVVMGCVLQAGQGQNVTRQAALKAGLPITTPSMTLNQVCGSGLRSVEIASTIIKAGEANVVVAGGMENMSAAPYLLMNARDGLKMGNKTFVDSMIQDGLWCALNDYHMGITAENIAEKYNISREEQDLFAVKSQNKAEKAQKEGLFIDEITPVNIFQKNGENLQFAVDEYIRPNSTYEKMNKLKPAFKSGGTVTAANASGINDGAAALVLANEDFASSLELKPVARVVKYANIGIEASVMGLGLIEAIKKVVSEAKISIDDIGLFELNEAFAAQSIAVINSLKINPDKVNVNGGAIAIGHPIGASGARILVTLIHEMKRQNVKYGLAALCIGGGQGTAIIIENM